MSDHPQDSSGFSGGGVADLNYLPGGVAIFLILTAAIETAAVVCACLPVIGPQLIKAYKKVSGISSGYPSYGNSSGPSADNKFGLPRSWRSKSAQGGSNQFGSLNHITDIDDTIDDQTRIDESAREGDEIRLNDLFVRDENSYDSGGAPHGPQWITNTYFADSTAGPVFPPPSRGRIVVQTDVEVEVRSSVMVRSCVKQHAHQSVLYQSGSRSGETKPHSHLQNNNRAFVTAGRF